MCANTRLWSNGGGVGLGACHIIHGCAVGSMPRFVYLRMEGSRGPVSGLCEGATLPSQVDERAQKARLSRSLHPHIRLPWPLVYSNPCLCIWPPKPGFTCFWKTTRIATVHPQPDYLACSRWGCMVLDRWRADEKEGSCALSLKR